MLKSKFLSESENIERKKWPCLFGKLCTYVDFDHLKHYSHEGRDDEKFVDELLNFKYVKPGRRVFDDDDEDFTRDVRNDSFFVILPSTVESNKSENQKTPIELALMFLPNPAAPHISNSGNKLHWNSSPGGHNTFFVEPEMVKGVYNITVEAKGSSLCFGLAIKKLLGPLACSCLHSQKSGTCCIHYCSICCGNTVAVNQSFFSSDDKVFLGLELNIDKRTLYFFVNNAQIPYCIVNVPASVHFGVAGWNQGLSVELKSLSKLTVSSINPSLSCAQYKWK